jgi:hypothetical protein
VKGDDSEIDFKNKGGGKSELKITIQERVK